MNPRCRRLALHWFEVPILMQMQKILNNIDEIAYLVSVMRKAQDEICNDIVCGGDLIGTDAQILRQH